jgi:surface antigen
MDRRPITAPYYAPRYYGPAYYSRPAYSRPAYGPIFSLGLFPAPIGDVMSQQDRDVYLSAYQRAIAAPVGESMAWNSRNASGSVTTTRDGWAGQRYCREFRQDITIGGNVEEATGTACQTAGGDWQIVQNQ